MAVGRGQVEFAERADRQVFEDAVDRDVHRMLRRAVGCGDAAADRCFHVEKTAAKIGGDLEEHALSFRFVAAAGRIVLAEFFRRQVRCNQRFRNQGKIEMNVHGREPSLSDESSVSAIGSSCGRQRRRPHSIESSC